MKGRGGPGQTPPPGSGVNPLSWKPQIGDGRRRRSRGRRRRRSRKRRGRRGRRRRRRGRRRRRRSRKRRARGRERAEKTLLWPGLGGRVPSSLLHLITSYITLLSTEMMETETPLGWTVYCRLLTMQCSVLEDPFADCQL